MLNEKIKKTKTKNENEMFLVINLCHKYYRKSEREREESLKSIYYSFFYSLKRKEQSFPLGRFKSSDHVSCARIIAIIISGSKSIITNRKSKKKIKIKIETRNKKIY